MGFLTDVSFWAAIMKWTGWVCSVGCGALAIMALGLGGKFGRGLLAGSLLSMAFWFGIGMVGLWLSK